MRTKGAVVSQLDDVLGSLLGGKGGGGGGDLGSILGGLTGSGGRGGGGNMLAALLPLAGSLLAGGGLQKMLSGFQAKGLGAQADSWVGTGANEAVSGAQVRDVVGDDEIGSVAQKLGVSNDQAADALAEVLPKVVDHASPDGQLPSQEELDAAFAKLERTGS
jgi:uncharacterized protein YidB (DUF937 family)